MRRATAGVSACTALTVLTALPLAAQNYRGAFVIRLGHDTTAVERFERTRERLAGEDVLRAPRAALRTFTITFDRDGTVRRAEIANTRPGSPADSPPNFRVVATFSADSLTVETYRDTAVTTRHLAAPAGVIPNVAGAASSWVGLELASLKLRKSKQDSIAVPVYTMGGNATGTWSVWKIAGRRDSIARYDGNDVFHAKVDGDGRIQGAVPLSGTQQFTVERVRSADTRALYAAFAARDNQGQALGTLSPRDTVRASVAGANLWIDYGRPSKRGRVIFGSTIVPWGQVWRTGANAATQFRTDRDLEIQGTTIPAGTYTLWTVPNQSGGWKLLFNRQTGQWGTEHDPARDFAQVDLRVTALPAPAERFTISVEPQNGGGVLQLDWDTTRAAVNFNVR